MILRQRADFSLQKGGQNVEQVITALLIVGLYDLGIHIPEQVPNLGVAEVELLDRFGIAGELMPLHHFLVVNHLNPWDDGHPQYTQGNVVHVVDRKEVRDIHLKVSVDVVGRSDLFLIALFVMRQVTEEVDRQSGGIVQQPDVVLLMGCRQGMVCSDVILRFDVLDELLVIRRAFLLIINADVDDLVILLRAERAQLSSAEAPQRRRQAEEVGELFLNVRVFRSLTSLLPTFANGFESVLHGHARQAPAFKLV